MPPLALALAPGPPFPSPSRFFLRPSGPFGGAGCTTETPTSGSAGGRLVADTITVDALRQRLEKGERVTVLDVRDAEDHAEWTIPGALGCDAYDDLSAGRPGRIATFDLLPRGVPVVTVCYAGNTSRIAADALRERGFDAVSLAGGMNAWSLAWNTADVSLSGTLRILQVRRTGKGCLSYIVASGREAVVVDPSLDASLYVQIAREHGWTIKRVLETHVHADHLSRARSLCAATGAMLHMPQNDRVSFPYEPVVEGTSIRVGEHAIVALRTPGHTNESTCYHVDGRALLTGDTLFVNSIGRPDLEADRHMATARAVALHATLQRIQKLPPDTLILPCHTSEPVPFDRRPLVAELKQVRARVPFLVLGRDEFVTRVLEKLPPTPPNHKLIVKANEAGELAGLDAMRVEAGANRCAIR